MADNINEDVTDLTDDSVAEAQEQPKRRRDAQTTPPPPPPVDKKGAKTADKTGNGKKKKKNRLLILLLIGIPVILIGAFVTLVIINLFGMRDIVGGFLKDPLIDAVVWFDPEFSSVEATIREAGTKRQKELDERENGIAEREAELEGLGLALDDRETQLDRRSDALDRREQNISQVETSANVPVYQRVLTEKEIEEMQSLSRSFSSMSPEAAAGILAELYTLEDAATILFYMTERNAGAILAVLDVEIAARITEILLGSDTQPLGGLSR